MADSKRRSARVLAERKRSIYFEPTTDDEFEQSASEGEEEYRPLQEREQEDAPAPSATPSRPKKKRKVERKPKPQTRAKEKRMERFKAKGEGRQRKKYGVNWIPPTPSKNKQQSSTSFSGPSDGVVPDWTRLPPEIWRDIFIYASQPIHEQSTTAIANVTWLMRTARTCRAFAVPALEAYYQSPSILPTTPPHSLLGLLQMPQEELYMNYKYRVKSLEIDVRRLAQGAHGRRPFKLDALVAELPRLQHLEVVHPQHTSPYRSYKKQAWEYPPNLFQDLEEIGTRLKTWRWSQNMIPTTMPNEHGAWMSQIHNTKLFQHLERLVLCNFDHVTIPQPSDPSQPAQPPSLTTAIAALPNLKDLTFISCEAIETDFLLHLPPNLHNLELHNCLEVTSSMLENFLTQNGSHLRTLILNHNAALSLAFLPTLRPSCPHLEVLKIDLTYYSERMNFNDAAALYDHVLTADQIPTWPSTLRHLEIVHLQKLEAEAAQNLFSSLVEGARELGDLRWLALQAHIDIPWRDRAGFRERWIERLKRVYLRKKEMPDPRLASLKAWRMWKEGQGDQAQKGKGKAKEVSHVRVTPRKARQADTTVYSDAAAASPAPRRRSTRVAESRSASTAAEESSSPDSSDDESADEADGEPAFIQGLCDVVDIRIDNQRPRENQYTEANFLDSEPSGDEDWREGASGDEGGDGYAW